ncbi:low temperature requirement protein LtrA [Leucobacter komagatae]|uniref:Low temperature requirement protein LtrA n=1 Tax=Leucobacter komagatae TaxID=55969 RepID=A0A542Y892_9MICO|nr:low temperature requirement protein A [Leucobacter komagatae]TQL44275.1 low temperature requirement protein LtrA [Leucobacter komagatae]
MGAAEHPRRLGIPKTRARDPLEVFRSSSPLELFLDLVFAIAVSLSSAQLFRAETSAHIGEGVVAYLMVFFAVWWAWMNFTWFASAFDSDDWLYRVLTLSQMAGAIVLAVGATPAMVSGDFGLIIGGYVVMRLALVAQWVRVACGQPEFRRTALRFAIGVSAVQVFWVLFAFVPDHWSKPLFCVLVIAELAVPAFAESAGQTPWHPGHIVDRFGSFTLIVLAESVLAATTAAANAIEEATHLTDFVLIGFSGFALAAGMWWIYFSTDAGEWLQNRRNGLPFGIGHYLVFAAAGAFSTGIKVLLDYEAGRAAVTAAEAMLLLAVPVAVFILGVWALILRRHLTSAQSACFVLGAALVALCPLLAFAGVTPPVAALVAAGVMAALVVVIEVWGVRGGSTPRSVSSRAVPA